MCSGRVRPKLCGEPPQRTGGPPVLPGILARTPAFFGISLGAARAQDALNPPETGELVISATRFPLPEEETPASVSVIMPRDLEEKQIERISDALRDIPGLSVVQSGAPGAAHFDFYPRTEERTHPGVARWESRSARDWRGFPICRSYALSDAGNPNTIFTPKPFDNFLTERWLIAPHLDYQRIEW